MTCYNDWFSAVSNNEKPQNDMLLLSECFCFGLFSPLAIYLLQIRVIAIVSKKLASKHLLEPSKHQNNNMSLRFKNVEEHSSQKIYI